MQPLPIPITRTTQPTKLVQCLGIGEAVGVDRSAPTHLLPNPQPCTLPQAPNKISGGGVNPSTWTELGDCTMYGKHV